MATEGVTKNTQTATNPGRLSWLISMLPLIAIPFMLTARNMDFILPNEEPKWGILLVSGALAAIAAVWLLHKKVYLSFHLPAIMLLLFASILGLGIWMAPDQMMAISRFAYWFSCIAIWLAAVYAIRHNPTWLNWFSWATALSALLFSLLYLKGYLMDYNTPGYNISVLFSPIGHVNYSSDALLILLPILLWILASKRSILLLSISWIATVICGSVILVAASRGVMAGLILGAIVAAIIAFRHLSPRSIRSNILALCLTISALVGAFILYANMPYHFRDAARLSDTFSGSGPKAEEWANMEEKIKGNEILPPLAGMWAGMSSYLGRRTPLYASTLSMVFDKPFIGHGTGSFIDIYPKYSNHFPGFYDPHSDETSIVDNPHNAFLQIAAENGLPAAFLFLTLLLLFLKRLLLHFSRHREWLTAAGVVAVTAAIVDSMFNQIFFSPVSMFLFALFGGLLWGHIGSFQHKKKDYSVLIRLHPLLRILLTAAVILLMLWPAKWLISEWYAGQGWQLEYRMPLTTKQLYHKALEYNPGNYLALYNSIKIDMANKELLKAELKTRIMVKAHPYHAPTYNLLGMIHMQLGNREEATQSFKMALQILPGFHFAQVNLERLKRMPKH